MMRRLLVVSLLLVLAACQRPGAAPSKTTAPAAAPSAATTQAATPVPTAAAPPAAAPAPAPTTAEARPSGGFFSRMFRRQSDSEAAKPEAAIVEVPKGPVRYRHCAECLLDADGREVPASLAIRGYVENAEQRGNMFVVSGWAADIDRKGPPAELLFISRGVVVWRGVPTGTRGDVAQELGITNTAVFGYSFEVPATQIGNPSVIWAIDHAGRAKTLEVIRR